MPKSQKLLAIPFTGKDYCLIILFTADPHMPKSRKLLAIPFTGKDVPSRASEFAHPDVVIGRW